MKKLIIMVLLILLSSLLIPTNTVATSEISPDIGICGDGICDVEDGEDASTCYKDCSYTDYIKCEISLRGGMCNYDNVEKTDFKSSYFIKGLESNGCSSGERANITISFEGGEVKYEFIPGIEWIPVHGGVQFFIHQLPCGGIPPYRIIYFKGAVKPEKLNEYFRVSSSDINLKKDSKFTIDYKVPTKMARPYCKTEIRNYDTQELVSSISDLGCNKWTIPINNVKPGGYVVISGLYDEGAEYKLGEKVTQIVFNECHENNECSDGKFYTKDICSGREIEIGLESKRLYTCSSQINQWSISLIGLGIIVIMLVVFFLFRKRNLGSQ